MLASELIDFDYSGDVRHNALVCASVKRMM